MERGETRVEKALRNGFIEWHVYRMGHLTDYYIGTVRRTRRWRAITPGEDVTPVDAAHFPTRKAAIEALCKADDLGLGFRGGEL